MKKEFVIGIITALVFLLIPFAYYRLPIPNNGLADINTFFSKLGLQFCGGLNTICATFIWDISFFLFFMILGFFLGYSVAKLIKKT